MLTIKSITKKFKKTIAVNDVGFTLNKGEITALLGPNGAGKSTLIKTCCGLLKQDSGSINIGTYANRSQQAKRLFSYIPEFPELYELLTVKEHLQFIASAYDVKGWQEKAEKLMKRYDLHDKQQKLAKELSKGMKQKVSICCGLLAEHDLYFFDEPMIGLDPKAIRETKKIFSELAEAGKTILVSTHLLDSIENLCHRVLIMQNGSIISDETMAELKKQISNREDITLEDLFLEVTEHASV